MREKAERASLMSGGRNNDGGVSGASQEQRDRMLQTNERLQNQNNQIRNAIEIAEETEGVAMEITQELGRHRERIKSIHGRVHETSDMAERARRLLTRMNRREVQQKLILAGVALVLLAAIGVIIYYCVV